jgi:CspA family cold shock protein
MSRVVDPQSGGRAFQRKRKERTVHKGIVKWFNPTKGYGFIERTNGGKDVFIDISAVERAGLSTLAEGQNVTFDIVVNRGRQGSGRKPQTSLVKLG